MWYNQSVNRSYCIMRQNIERGQTLMKRIFSVATAVLLVSTLLMTFTSCGSSDNTEETKEVVSTEEAVYTESAVPVNKTSEEVLAYFNSNVNGEKLNKPAVSYRKECSQRFAQSYKTGTGGRGGNRWFSQSNQRCCKGY